MTIVENSYEARYVSSIRTVDRNTVWAYAGVSPPRFVEPVSSRTRGYDVLQLICPAAVPFYQRMTRMSYMSMRQIMGEADEAVWELKEKQFRTLALLLSVLAFAAVAYQFYRTLAQGLGSPTELIGPSASYTLILVSLLPSKILSFKNRVFTMILSGFVASLSAIVAVGTLGSGYILLVLDAFIVHYFLKKKLATILIACLLTIMSAVSLMHVFGLLPTLPIMSVAMLNGYTISKIFVVVLTVAGLHFMDNRSTDILKQSLTDSITSREKLRTEQVVTNEYLESIPGIFFLFNSDLQLERWNQNMSRHTGYSPEELKGKNVLTFFEPGEQVRIRQKISEVFVIGSAYTEGELLSKDGTKTPFSFTSRSVEIGGKAMACGIGQDISEKRKLEIEVQKAQKMEAIGTLAGGIAHDFNNILQGMIGFTELALDEVQDRSSTKKELEQVLKAGRRATDLVKQILSFSRSQKSETKPIKPATIANEVVKLMRASLPSTIEIAYAANSKRNILADPTKIHQVLMNLCTNAGHAMKQKGGVLTISLQDVMLEQDDLSYLPDALPGEYLKISVEDTGTGMTKDVQEKAFDPFFTTKKQGEGTGMGLSTVHGIITGLGGFISLYSEPNRGTAMHLFIPSISDAAKIEAGHSDISLKGGTERILLVDDEQIQINLTEEVLSRYGYRVTAFSDSTIALTHFQQNPYEYDLVITDMTMPKITGDFLSQKIHLERPDIPVVMCTGFSENIDEQKAMALNIDALLYKPVIRAKLLETIRKVLDQYGGQN